MAAAATAADPTPSPKAAGPGGGGGSSAHPSAGGLGKLLWYVKHEDVGKLRALLEEHPELANDKDYDGRTALHVASVHDCARAADTLLQFGAKVNELDRRKNSVSLLLVGARDLAVAMAMAMAAMAAMAAAGSRH